MATPNIPGIDPLLEAACDEFRTDYKAIQAEIGKAIVGHQEIVDGVLTCLFVGGHALLEGVPGLGKTALIRTLASALDLKFSRIQFTPDLMPADVIGTNVIMENDQGHRAFTFMAGPIFAQIVLADEINRATPKTQSAMLEAMQEKQVTAGGQVRKLEQPFFVMATQNPLEQEGTYPLPEAQLDRFFYKLIVQYSGRDELRQILDRTTTSHRVEIKPIINGQRILEHQDLVKRVVIAPHVQDYAIRCVLATHPQGMFAVSMTNQFLRFGASPRAAQAITLAGKVRALLDGRFHVSFQDVKDVAIPAMRHRIILNFEGEAEGITTDMVIEKVLAETPQTIEDELVTGKALMTTAAAEKSDLLIDPAFMARLDQLDVLSRKLLAGKLKGERRSKRRGQSVEFADYRNYTVGDDLRFIDWNIYARLDRLFLKLFLEEEDLSLYILIDTSLSVNYGNPDKAIYLKRVAAALGYIGLVNYNRVHLCGIADGITAETGALRGRRRVGQMIDFVSKLTPAGPSHFADACKKFAMTHRHKGVCVVLSDFFVKEGFEMGLRYIAGGKYDLFCVQVLSPQEIDPDLAGDLKLRDVEDGDMAEVSITQPLLACYKRNLNAYCLSLKDYLTRRGGTYLFTSTAVPFDTLVLNYLRERGLLG